MSESALLMPMTHGAFFKIEVITFYDLPEESLCPQHQQSNASTVSLARSPETVRVLFIKRMIYRNKS